MSQKNTPFRVYKAVMTGSWVEFVIPANGNTVLMQARNAVDIQVSNFSDGSDFWTMKANTGLKFNSFNTDGQSIYLNGGGGEVVEIFVANKP